MLERVAERLAMDGIDVFRAYLDSIDDGENGQITLLGFVVQREQGVLVEDSALWRVIRRDLQRNKWVDTAALKLSYTHAGLGQRHAEVLDAVIELAHQKLVKVNRWAYSRVRLRRWTSENIALCQKIADLLLARFDPTIRCPSLISPLGWLMFERRWIGSISTHSDCHQAMLDAVAVRRTNVFIDERYGLAFRIDPGYLHHEDRRRCLSACLRARRNFAGHVRFRDIAGEVCGSFVHEPKKSMPGERTAVYDEAFNLAFAQQLKNKDIPEGSQSRGIGGPIRSQSVVIAIADSLLDLITLSHTPRTHRRSPRTTNFCTSA